MFMFTYQRIFSGIAVGRLLVVQWPMANCHMLQLRWSQDTSESKLTTGKCLRRLSMSAAASGWKSSLPRPRQKEVALPTGFSVSW